MVRLTEIHHQQRQRRGLAVGGQHRGEGVCGADRDRGRAAAKERAVLPINRLCQVGSILYRVEVPDSAVRPTLYSKVPRRKEKV
jgi:hypothetical protein